MAVTRIIFFYAIVILCISCSKNKRGCWQAFSPSGGDLPGLVICDKTRSEAEAEYPGYWFYNADEKKYCWQVQQAPLRTLYIRNIPQSMVDRLAYDGYTYIKTDCNSFCIWSEIYEKRRSKVTGLY